jgi:aspartyl-tRNA(Asn)/glutamyl-tRNA(Gln) amidotransferase subunit A
MMEAARKRWIMTVTHTDLTIAALSQAYRTGEVTAAAAVRATFERIAQYDPKLHCFHELYEQQATEQATKIDADRAAGKPLGPLAGVPIALKDNIVTDFGHTTCSSRILENYQSPFTATSAKRLMDAGAIIIGKTNCDEFAMGSSTENCAFGATFNPWDTSRVPGGSSGGSAAAVAARFCPAALGSDTGGSVRQPAALCGIVGVKPTYGRISRYGLIAFGSSFDQIGPFARTVEDAALLVQVMAGHDPADSTCADAEVPDLLSQINEPVEGLRIGVPREYVGDENDPAVSQAIEQAVDLYKSFGAEIVDLELPMTKYGISTYYVITPAEASSNLARYDGIRYGRRATLEAGEDLFDLYAKSRAEGFGPEVQRRIMLGTYVLSAGYYDAYYKRAMQVRRLIKQEYDRAFKQCHAIIGPTSPTAAFPIGAKKDPLAMYLSDLYTTNTNTAGICGISIPAGFDRSGDQPLPIGLQIQCQAFDEATMFRVARMFESATAHHQQAPAFS